MIITVMHQAMTMSVESTAFKDGSYIPEKYTCEGVNASPEIIIRNIPKGTISLALIMDDPDASNGTFDHWILFNIKASDSEDLILKENFNAGTFGKNGKGKNEYTGPCPPSGIHHYNFRVYALDVNLDVESGATKQQVEKAMDQHIIAQSQFTGLYQKSTDK
jgi:Raf kinase inhibitor-like YbhB/YbcL family protein